MPRILGVDYGLKRIGLAVSDPAAVVAVALRTVSVESDDAACRAVEEACRETETERIVVGIPIRLDGSLGPAAARVQAFVERLRARVGVPIVTWDERLSTSQVERALIGDDVSRSKRRDLRDKLAARVVLQSYIEAQCSGIE